MTSPSPDDGARRPDPDLPEPGAAVDPAVEHAVLREWTGVGMAHVSVPVTALRIQAALDAAALAWIPGRRPGHHHVQPCGLDLDDPAAAALTLFIAGSAGRPGDPPPAPGPDADTAPVHHVWSAGFGLPWLDTDHAPRLLVLANNWNNRMRYPTAWVIFDRADTPPRSCTLQVEQHVPTGAGLSTAALEDLIYRMAATTTIALERLGHAVAEGLSDVAEEP